MRGRLLILCPGQGSQHAGMFAMARSHPAGAALLDQCRLPDPAHAPDRPDPLFTNRIAQPAIVAASLAIWQALREAVPAPALVAGYSIGELAAYGVAGALAPLDAVRLAGTRARLMDECLQRFPGQAMVAITGAPLARIAEVIASDLFYIAIETGADSCIAGGPAAALEALHQALLTIGARGQRLPVEVASHTSYMAPAVARFAEALRQADFHAQHMPVLSGISATKVEGKAHSIEQLSRQVAEKIVWADCMDACSEAAVTVALELGPGSALSRMLQARHPGIACRSVEDFRSLTGIRKWLDASLG